jgi:hypothetical protein
MLLAAMFPKLNHYPSRRIQESQRKFSTYERAVEANMVTKWVEIAKPPMINDAGRDATRRRRKFRCQRVIPIIGERCARTDNILLEEDRRDEVVSVCLSAPRACLQQHNPFSFRPSSSC